MTDDDYLTLAYKHFGDLYIPDNRVIDFARDLELLTIERCAVAAWHHYMETVRKDGLSPIAREKYCAANSIRLLKLNTLAKNNS
jgi:hypothetical protein